jgi:carbamoyl-phosphate synthase/aspartate carbamoyltransferase/dihydroorotase
MPNEVMDYIGSKGIPQTNFSSLEDALPETDVLYMTRIQRERFATQQEYDMVRYHKKTFFVCTFYLF